jgi:prevent-host-death family protein
MRTEDIHPMSEHRAHLTEHLRLVQETGRPMVITQNGRPAAVVLSPSRYDELVRLEELAEDVAAIKQGFEDATAGRGQDAKDALRKIADKYDLKLDP